MLIYCSGSVPHTHRNNQHVIGNVKGTASESLVMTLEGFVVLACDDFVGRVNVDTLCLNIVALQSHSGQLRMYSTGACCMPVSVPLQCVPSTHNGSVQAAGIIVFVFAECVCNLCSSSCTVRITTGKCTATRVELCTVCSEHHKVLLIYD